MPREILLVITRFLPAPGGAQRYVYELARCLSLTKWPITVLSTDLWLTGSRSHQRIPIHQMLASDASAPFAIVRTSPRLFRGYPIFFGTGCIQFLIHGRVLHINESLDGLLFYFPLILAARIRCQRVVVTIHIVYRNARSPFNQIGNLAGRLTLNLCSMITLMSKADIHYTSRLLLTKRKIALTPPGVEDIASWGGQEAGQDSRKGATTLLTVASLTELKGIDDALIAIAMLPKPLGVRYWIAGPDVGYGKNLSELASKLNLSERVDFLGQINRRSEIKRIYREADIVVIPSRYETGPITLLEAMASGKPIVATKVGLIPEIIKDRENGVLVEPSSPTALAKAIEYLILNEHLRNSIGLRARQAAQKYDIQVLAEKFSQLYEMK